MSRVVPITEPRLQRIARRHLCLGFAMGVWCGAVVVGLGWLWHIETQPAAPPARNESFTPTPPGWPHTVPQGWQLAPIIITPPCQECLWL
jgi:hypothetical protein